MTSIPMWVLAIVVIGAIAYIYYVGGSDDPGENYGIAFMGILVGMIVGGIFL